jgi:hypothetical protein
MARTIVGTDKRYQFPIQFQEDGVNEGTRGTVEIFNFTGSGVSVARVGNTLTVSISGGGGGGSANNYFPGGWT